METNSALSNPATRRGTISQLIFSALFFGRKPVLGIERIRVFNAKSKTGFSLLVGIMTLTAGLASTNAIRQTVNIHSSATYATLQETSPGQDYRFEFDGSSLPNGVYLCRLTTGSEVLIDKFMITR